MAKRQINPASSRGDARRIASAPIYSRGKPQGIQRRGGVNKTILLVEDDPGISELVKIVLSQKKYHVKICTQGTEVVACVQKTKPALILMDLWLPGIDGAQLTKKLKSKKLTKSIPIIIMSAQNALPKVVSKSGADGFLAKPFDLPDLLATVEKYLT